MGRPRGERFVFDCACGCGRQVEKTARDVELNKTGRFFFSAECRDRVGVRLKTGETLVCEKEGCEETFYRPPYSNQRFHSAQCRDTSNYAGGTIEVRCAHCEEIFKAFRSQVSRTGVAYHDRACRDAARKAASGKPRKTSHGYMIRTMPDHPAANKAGYVFEHRLIMDELLMAYRGSPMVKGETVHHINHVKDDNTTDGPLRIVNGSLRSGNLELWNKFQPSGARVPELLDYARSLMRLYAPQELKETS